MFDAYTTMRLLIILLTIILAGAAALLILGLFCLVCWLLRL